MDYYFLSEVGIQVGVYLLGLLVGLYLARWFANPEVMPMYITFAFLWPLFLVVGVFIGMGYLGWRLLTAHNLFVWVDHLIARLTLSKMQQDEYGELWQHRAPQENVVFVRVKDSTGTHDIRVPPITKTAKEGVAWTYRLTPEQYAPKIRV